jgi:nucleoside-diphosphate-sugar epimerase
LVEGDLADPGTARRLCENAAGAVLFHVAGVVHPTRGLSELEQVNVAGTRHLLEAAANTGVRRVVVVSSNSPFGFNPSPDHLFDESSPYNPYMGYGRSKHRMELLVDRAQESGKIETVIIRPPWFYGPHQPARQSTFFKMIKEGRFPIIGDGHQKRSMAYVDNICQGLLLAATVDRANGQKYWIADERPYSILEIVETVRQVLEQELGIRCKDQRLRAPGIAGTIASGLDGVLQRCGLYSQKIHVLGEMGRTIACSIDKAVGELGYSPRVELREGMIASVRWCLASGQRF